MNPAPRLSAHYSLAQRFVNERFANNLAARARREEAFAGLTLTPVKMDGRWVVMAETRFGAHAGWVR